MVPPKNNQAPKKGSKGTSSSSRVSEDLILFKEDSTRPVMVVIHSIESTDSIEESTTPILFDKLSANFDLSSQVPKLIIHMDEYAISFHVHNFTLANADSTVQTPDDCIFKHLTFGGNNPANWSIAGIQSAFVDVLDTPGLTFDQAVELYKFGRGVLNEKSDDNVNEKARAGFFALNFIIKGRISPPRLCDGCVPNNDSEVRDLKFQRTLKKGNFLFTLVRNFGNFSDDLDAYWKHRVAACSQQGLWPIFNGHVTEIPCRRFKDWYTNPTKFLPHEPWMAEAPAERSENGIQRYVAHNARNNFGSMTGWEIVFSAAVIHDVAASIKLNEQYYNWDRTYEAIKEGEQAIYGSSEGKVAVQDVFIDGINSIEWTAQVLVAEKNKQFVISFIMPHGKRRKFHVGSKVDVQLKVLNRHLAITRQLKAIGMIAENNAKDDTYGRILQRFIIGEGMTDVKDDIEDHLLSLKEIAYTKLPLLSQKIYDQWLENALPATIIQGQSGTGKSLTSAVTCVGIAQLGYKVIYATPTNAAAETALLSIFNVTQKLFEAVNNATIGVNPAPELLAEIKESKENFDSEEDNSLDTYRTSNHVIKSFQCKANNPESSNTIRTKTHNWLATLQRVREGKSVAADRFVKEGIDEIEEVVRKIHSKIIISTCNNSAALRDMEFKPQVVLLDDASASASREPDCIIPLTCEQAHVVLYGEVVKRTVWPGVKSWGSSEFAAQLSRSLFERLVGMGNMRVVQLEHIDSADPVIDVYKQ
ncbi:hypothetical protein BOTNAR_0558g00020 [Botryotinia narcissicola]|uniref:DNA2/NAM7 helicase helicase domain-containing protein n=1 Tax=Botryotinia narcissicola TaxID=278944 RepID=A0A4Z1HET0_9HELO|nr:hypothetical protein BOTNAR_0558g00020 [Botryotinia narcissicola]